MYLPWDEYESALNAKPAYPNANPFIQFTSQMKILWSQWWTAQCQKNLRAFRPKVRLFLERDQYVIKTVESSWELEECLRLRHEIFYQELLNSPSDVGLDMDQFDLICDHLAIVDRRTRKIVGTYRVISSTYSSRFYSAGEFDISQILSLPGNKLELGRACIKKEYRNGLIIALLWRGIMQYAQSVDAKMMFGCSSIPTTDPSTIMQICTYLKAHHFQMEHISIPVKMSYRMPQLNSLASRRENLDPVELDSVRKSIPPLLLSYLKSGARVGPVPALDRAFRCVDFMTILELDKISTAHQRKFAKC
jgi:putative hemolysin